MTEPLLQVHGLRTRVDGPDGGLEILRGVDLSADAGETVAVVGESGSGKSITALSIGGLLPAAATITGGVVHFGGQDLVPMPEPERRRIRGAQIAMIYQDPMTSLNPVLRIGTQVTEALTAHGWPKQRARRRAVEVLDEVGLPSPASVMLYPHQLSGGMRQRVLIAIAIAPRPSLLIADEPTTALDVTVQSQIIDLIARLRSEYGLAVVWITHDFAVVSRVADRVAVMYAGRIAEVGDKSAILARPAHPYTAGLLQALPDRHHGHRQPLPQIGGVPVSLAALPPGCPFEPRCPQAQEQCRDREPDLIDRTTSWAACLVPPADWRPIADEADVHA